MNSSVMETIQECLNDYSDPIYLVGIIHDYDVDEKAVTTISATIPKEELVIMNNKFPKWYSNIVNNSLRSNNILYIKDFEQISTEEQKMFVDIISKGYFASEKLPENLKIIINSKTKCPIIPEISEVVQYFEV